MASFAKKAEVKSSPLTYGRARKTFTATPDTVNLAGGVAFKKEDKLQLVSLMFTSFVENQFYRTKDQTLTQLQKLIASVDLEFAAKAAVYTRTKMGMRSITHAAAAIIAHTARGKGLSWVKNFINNVVYRVDDASEILAAYLSLYGKPIPNALKKGLALSLSKFDAYQIAKYRGDKDSVKLVDLFNLVHPKPNKEQADTYKKLMQSELTSSGTWEVELSEAGKSDNKAKAKADVWKNLLKNNKLPYFALLRNMRNILETESEEIVKLACTALTNEKSIKKSLVLPFRFVTASKEIAKLPAGNDLKRLIEKAISQAVETSLSNVPKVEGSTLVAIDTSYSMVTNKLSGKSETTACDVACLFGAILAKRNDCDVVLFSDNATYHDVNSQDSLITVNNRIVSMIRPGGTNFASIFLSAKKKYDNVIILSDEQAWKGNTMQAYRDYCNKFRVFPNLFSFDLTGYGTAQFPAEGIFSLAGFSEKAFDLIAFMKSDRDAMIKVIEEVSLN